jgi:lysophospholipase L1-like esterase
MASFLGARFASVAPLNKNFIAVGDSMSSGFLATSPWPDVLAASLGSTGTKKAHDGSGWTLISGSPGASLTELAPEVDAILASPPQTLIMFAGTNDWSRSNSAADTHTARLAYLTARRAAGFTSTAIFINMLPRSNGGSGITPDAEAFRTDYNARALADAAANNYIVARTDLDSRIGLFGCQNDTTYFYTDQLHPINPGHAVIAGIVQGLFS